MFSKPTPITRVDPECKVARGGDVEIPVGVRARCAIEAGVSAQADELSSSRRCERPRGRLEELELMQTDRELPRVHIIEIEDREIENPVLGDESIQGVQRMVADLEHACPAHEPLLPIRFDHVLAGDANTPVGELQEGQRTVVREHGIDRARRVNEGYCRDEAHRESSELTAWRIDGRASVGHLDQKLIPWTLTVTAIAAIACWLPGVSVDRQARVARLASPPPRPSQISYHRCHR